MIFVSTIVGFVPKKGRFEMRGGANYRNSFKTEKGFGFEPCGLPCVLRNKLYISDPNYSNKMLILELRPASTCLFVFYSALLERLNSIIVSGAICLEDDSLPKAGF